MDFRFWIILKEKLQVWLRLLAFWHLLTVTVNQYEVRPACDHSMVVERKEKS